MPSVSSPRLLEVFAAKATPAGHLEEENVETDTG
jgi:hypothetical protein